MSKMATLRSTSKVEMQVTYRNCTECGAPLVGKTVKATEQLQKRGMCAGICQPVEDNSKSATQIKSESGHRGGTKRAQFLKDHTPLRHGEPPTRLPISADQKLEARIDAIVAAANAGNTDRDVVLMDKKFRIRGGRRLG